MLSPLLRPYRDKMRTLACLALLGLTRLISGSSPPLIISLETGWPAPPLLHEILETVYDESPSAYFALLGLLPHEELSPEKTLSTILHLIDSHSLLPDPSSLSTLHYALGLHTAVPRIEAFYNWYEASIDEHRLGVEGCGSWVEYKGKGYCNAEDLDAAMADTFSTANPMDLLPFDHARDAVGILYYDPSSQPFDVDRFIVRYKPARQTHQTPMSGYGVELALKRTDYLVVDDRQAKSQGKATQWTHSGPFDDVLGSNPWQELSIPLTANETNNLGLKAASLIMSSPDPLAALTHLSQDFPKYSAALARKVNVSGPISEAIGRMLSQPVPVRGIFINGKLHAESEIDAYSLLNTLRTERDLAKSLVDLGLAPSQAIHLLTDSLIGRQQTEDDTSDGLVDASDRHEGGNVIIWWNDIEKDSRYKGWSTSISGYLRPLYPGQMHSVRRNTFNAVVILDLSYPSSLEIITEQIIAVIKGGIPIRFGVVPMLSNDASVAMANLLQYCVKTFGRGYTRELLIKIHAATPRNARVSINTMHQAYEVVSADSDKEHLPFEQVIASDSTDEVRQYLSRLAATTGQGHIFLNGKYIPLHSQWMQYLSGELMTQVNFLQQQLIADVVTDENISTLFYDLPSTSLRRNLLIVPSATDNKLRIVSLDKVFPAEAYEQLIYPDREVLGSVWIVGDLNSEEGRKLVSNAVTYLQDSASTGLGFLHTPFRRQGVPCLIDGLIKSGRLGKMSPAELASTLDGLDENQSCSDDTIGPKIAEALGITTSHPYILYNGRLVGPVTEAFVAEDFAALEAYEMRKRVKPVFDLLQTMMDTSTYDKPRLAKVISMASATLASAYTSADDGIFTPTPLPRSREYELASPALTFSVGDEQALVRIAAVLDPISEGAQRAASLLQTMAEMDGVSVSVHLLPAPMMREVPLKRFYRFVSSPRLTFDSHGNPISPEILFEDLPSTPIFTLAMDTPPAWIVSPRQSRLDLDNLVTGSVSDSIHVFFTLKQLLIEGHAREANNAPPRGLQLQLTTEGLQVASDTQVMANLGYMQFKATPGVYHLAIRPGRGTEVYDLESVGNEGWDSAGVNVTGTRIALASFDGMTILPRFVRRPGMETANVLVEAPVTVSYPQAVFSRMKEMVGLAPKPAVKNADINIFTVASGLLYERFASIMILSVMKHTTSTVKFWFIENFLSPEFLEFLPKMAEEYNFQYEFVTYKWPRWLRAQTEKQRIIWAYKILFLDVLFPMNLDKVIFVDADQIVRVDMKELVDVDLHDHVYGYPPMGNSREEMEGFRFWKTGYWRDALRGRPYHISALYVVDLKRFRQLATGDRLRGQYHALSADPGSLANLDQDLPNSMQDQIPIFTLEQDWLWCQTWCDDESLATAKTIDLCQNPLTKEPKLVRARQIPEWDTYDQEIAAFAARVSKGDMGLAASVDDLASGPVTAGDKSDDLAKKDGTGTPDASEGESGHLPDEL
ncbi:UDP-glucose:Glyco protein glucosyltransferase-domain-containing protein, partial [Kockovaella imperatae]